MKQATKDGIKYLILGSFAAIGTYGLFAEFQQLESGQVESIRVWAPIAAVYNLGGVWSALGKWGGVLFLGFGAIMCLYFGLRGLIFGKEY